jgi:hypothetical protein
MTDQIVSDEPDTLRVIGGIDTHNDVHVAAVVDELGRLLDAASFDANRLAIDGSVPGCAVMARSSRSGSRAPARGVRDCHDIFGRAV